MTTKTKILVATGLLLTVLAGPVKADPSYGVVHNSTGTIVRNTTGNCVRTRWVMDHEQCVKQMTFTQEERMVYFEFNKATLTPAARAHLNSLIAKIKSAPGGVAGGRLVGYADRIGTPDYNEKLSKKRVETVRAYMAERGLTMTPAETHWVGDTEPTTDCPGTLPRKKLIQCLQADRKVEVELVYDP